MILLHLSDLHFGTHSRFKGEDLTKLGKAFFKDLNAARGSFAKDSRIDLVAVTGDIAESGKPSEFKEGELFLAALAGELGLERRRFVFVPGNHDVSWPACKKVEADQEEEGFDEGELRRRMDLVKLGRYEEFLRSFYGLEDLAEVAFPLGRGAYLYNFADFHLSVAALNTCEKESHRRADHVGLLSREQAEALMGEWRSSEKSGWLKIVTLHHNPVVTVASNIANWRKEIEKKGLAPDLAARYEGDMLGFEGREHLKAIVEDAHVQLVLHGHHHAKDEQSWDWRSEAKGRAAVLSSGSLTLNADKLPGDEPLSLRLIELETGKKEIRARSLVYDARGRTEGELRRGSFVADPVEPSGYIKDLYLPSGFEPKKARKQIKSRSPTGSSAFVRTYRLSLGASFARWDLAPVGVAQAGGAGKPIEAGLDEMYQPLRLAEGFAVNRTDRGKPMTPDALLVRRQPLAIRSAAGAGKTTWMRWTFRRLLREERALPLMLVVRDLARYWQSPGCHGAARSLASFLDAWAAERMGTGWERELRKTLEAEDGPRPILLVDGWDEAGKLGEELREKLVGLLAKCPRMLAVVTSRPYGEGRPSHAEGFEVLDIQPLADREIKDFSRCFFRQCYGEDELTAGKEVGRFWSALERSPEPRALARTALLLTMLLLIGRSRSLPDERHLLYEACIDNLLTALPDRKAEEGALLIHEQWRPEDSEKRMRVVASLSFGLQDEGYKTSGRSPIVRDWDGMAALLPGDWNANQRMGFLAWLAGPAGLFTDRADGTLAFAHLSFQEYLTAWYLNANIEGADERKEGFDSRKGRDEWWETLRLWAALIEKHSPNKLELVMESLMNGEPEGLTLVGAFLADGLGNELQFEAWREHWQTEFLMNRTYKPHRCAFFWATSQQDARKQALATRLREQSLSANWLECFRITDFLQEILRPKVLAVLVPKSLVNRCLIEGLDKKVAPSPNSVAAGRLLCSGVPLWPAGPQMIGLLHVWPGDRRILSLRLQSAVAMGISRVEIKLLIRHLIGQGRVSNELSVARRFVRHTDIYFDGFFTGYLTGHFARSMADDLARSTASDLAHVAARDLARDVGRYFGRYFSGHFTLDVASDCARVVINYLAPCIASYLTRQPVRRFVSPNINSEVNSLAGYLLRDVTAVFGGKENSFRYESFAQVEATSFGRIGARTTLAHFLTRPRAPETQILSAACRLSLHPGDHGSALNETLARYEPSLDPLWPALARHLARRATPEDRALLTDLAQHPEKREPPLSWGLQFIVRGDVLFDDGSVATLDELCDEAGVPRLLYLEDLPDELEVDWEG